MGEEVETPEGQVESKSVTQPTQAIIGEGKELSKSHQDNQSQGSPCQLHPWDPHQASGQEESKGRQDGHDEAGMDRTSAKGEDEIGEEEPKEE